MPRIATSGSTPESRRRHLLLLKSSSIDKRIQIAVADAKSVIVNSEPQQPRLSYAKQFIEADVLESSDSLECTTVLPAIHRASLSVSPNDADHMIHFARVSSTIEEFLHPPISSSSSSVYHVELANDNDEHEPHFISCFTLEPRCNVRRRRTSSLPSSIIVLDIPPLDTQRSSSLATLPLSWQSKPQQTIFLFDRQYNCQPMSTIGRNTLILCNDTQIDVYNILTGQCDETIRFQFSSYNNYRAVCYNPQRNELFIASRTFLYIYNIFHGKVTYQLHLPGSPFHLDTNKQIRYLTTNSSSIYHGYFALTSTCTTAVLSRLSHIGLKHVGDLEFDDGTMHGLHAFEQCVGIVICYGRYSGRYQNDYCLYVYDATLDNQLYRLDLKDIGYITGLTGYERTTDWILCDRQRARLIFINRESIEYVQYEETINQCVMLDRSGFFAVWLTDRVLLYRME